MHYRIAVPLAVEAGMETPLVCLHQSPKSGQDYERLIGHLGEKRVCIAPDAPGYGDSDAPPVPSSIADYGIAMLRLIEGLRKRGLVPEGPVDLMGYHNGSAIAAWIARHYPDRVQRIVLVSLPALDETQVHAALITHGRLVNFAEAGNGFFDLDTDRRWSRTFWTAVIRPSEMPRSARPSNLHG